MWVVSKQDQLRRATDNDRVRAAPTSERNNEALGNLSGICFQHSSDLEDSTMTKGQLNLCIERLSYELVFTCQTHAHREARIGSVGELEGSHL
jgi:hypothetical protein